MYSTSLTVRTIAIICKIGADVGDKKSRSLIVSARPVSDPVSRESPVVSWDKKTRLVKVSQCRSGVGGVAGRLHWQSDTLALSQSVRRECAVRCSHSAPLHAQYHYYRIQYTLRLLTVTTCVQCVVFVYVMNHTDVCSSVVTGCSGTSPLPVAVRIR